MAPTKREWKPRRKRKFETPEALEAVIAEYFANTPDLEITVTGLAMTIGGKQLFADYGRREGYAEIVADARAFVEDSYERDLRKKGGAGNIFALKNFGWKDQQDLNVEGKMTLDDARAVLEQHGIDPDDV